MEENEETRMLENPDSLEWGSSAKDCKVKLYIDLKKMSEEEIKTLITKANRMRQVTITTEH